MNDMNVIPLAEHMRMVKDSFPVLSAADFAGRPIPQREWYVEDLIPAKTVTLLGGDGGTGKSLLALQLAAASVIQGYWAGREVRGGSALYLSAEDDVDELHRRLADIATANNISLSGLHGLSIVPLAGKNAVLAAPEGKSGILKPTKLFSDLDALLGRNRTDLIVFDTLADIFGGDENIRAHARQFVGLVRRFCTRHDATVLLLAHPSVAGMSNGSGLSGSTAWNNSVRSRLYFERVKSGDGSEDDPDLRVLTTKKANYGRTGEEIRLRWQAGVFKPASADTSFSAMAAQSKADRVFVELLAVYRDEGRHVSPHPNAPTYAPAVFGKDQRCEGIKARGFCDAMNRLFAAKAITIGRSDGPPSKQKDIIIATDGRGK